MVDNRAAGYFGIGGAFNFKSGDISGTAARTQDDKMGQGGEYFAQQQQEEFEENIYIYGKLHATTYYYYNDQGLLFGEVSINHSVDNLVSIIAYDYN